MADSKQYKEQKEQFKVQILSNVPENPKIRCQNHRNRNIQFLNLNPNSQYQLICYQCTNDEYFDKSKLVEVEDFFSQDTNLLIQNWPPLNDTQIFKQLKEYLETDKQQNILSKIIKQFDKFEYDILKAIEVQKKKVITYANAMEENRQKVIQKYEDFSERLKIQNIFIKYQNDLENLNKKLGRVISYMQSESKDNEKELKDPLYNLNQNKQKLSIDYIVDFFNQTLLQLNSFDILNPIMQNEPQLQIKDTNKYEYRYDELQKEECKTDHPLRENSNHNALQQNYLMSDDQKYQSQYFNAEKVYIKPKRDISPNHYNSQPNLRINSNNQRQSTQQNFNTNQSYNFEPNSKSTHNMFQNKSFFNYNNNQDNKIDLLQKEIIKIDRDQEYLKVEQQDKSQIKVIHHYNNYKRADAILDQKIIPSNKYQIDIDLLSSLSKNKNIQLGIFSQNTQNEYFISTSNTQCAINQIDIGQHISKISEKVQTLHFQICFNQQILRCITIVDGQMHINSLSDWDDIQLNETYYFYFSLYHAHSQVLIKKFEKVNEFNQLQTKYLLY